MDPPSGQPGYPGPGVMGYQQRSSQARPHPPGSIHPYKKGAGTGPAAAGLPAQAREKADGCGGGRSATEARQDPCTAPQLPVPTASCGKGVARRRNAESNFCRTYQQGKGRRDKLN